MRALVAGILLGAVAFGAPAQAQDAPWPQQIEHRHARYAVTARVQDEAGDERERRLALANLQRRHDVRGDHDVVRRTRQAGKTPPWASAFAVVAREQDVLGDDHQAHLAALPSNARRFADVRRLRDLRGDLPILAQWKDERIRLGDLARERHELAGENVDERAKRYREKHEPRSANDNLADNERDAERQDERRTDRETERELLDRNRDNERELRQAEKDLERIEAAADKDDERELEQLEKATERDLEKAADDAEREAEREEEKVETEDDRETERQIQNEEEEAEADLGDE